MKKLKNALKYLKAFFSITVVPPYAPEKFSDEVKWDDPEFGDLLWTIGGIWATVWSYLLGYGITVGFILTEMDDEDELAHEWFRRWMEKYYIEHEEMLDLKWDVHVFFAACRQQKLDIFTEEFLKPQLVDLLKLFIQIFIWNKIKHMCFIGCQKIYLQITKKFFAKAKKDQQAFLGECI